uniref:Uncharacterized protein n=1 Tax=Sphaerodactylus townsendi TaxID=933632 RepID=A0ACB8F7X9_9SAUR
MSLRDFLRPTASEHARFGCHSLSQRKHTTSRSRKQTGTCLSEYGEAKAQRLRKCGKVHFCILRCEGCGSRMPFVISNNGSLNKRAEGDFPAATDYEVAHAYYPGRGSWQRRLNTECLRGLRELVPLVSEDGRIQFFSAGPVFTDDGFLYSTHATAVQRADGSLWCLVRGTLIPTFLHKDQAVDVVVRPASLSNPCLQSVLTASRIWFGVMESCQQRNGAGYQRLGTVVLPFSSGGGGCMRMGTLAAPENGVVKAKFIEVRGPWISYTANPANAMLGLTIKVCSKPEGEPALLTLKLEARLTTTFEVSGSKLIAKLSLDSSDGISISTPVARTPVGRYRQWSETVVRKTLAVLNRAYKERAPTLSTLKHMSNPAVTISQDLLHIHETA